jgi:predicted AlkP superfamily phosphohydrolase/phosphomutase
MIILSGNDILEFERIYEKDSIKRIQISFNSEISKQVNDYLQKIEDAHESAKKSKLIFNNYLTFTNP